MSSSPKRPAARATAAVIAARDSALDWSALSDVVHRDEGARGLASYRVDGLPLDDGQLRAAALELARGAQAVGIVTGFCVVLPDRVTAETDGPPGALFLAEALRLLGVEVTLITDRYGLPLLKRGSELLGLEPDRLVEFPTESAGCDDWIADFLSQPCGRRLSHLVAIERAGPSHTSASIAAQATAAAAPLERFAADVPLQARDVCHNMRGTSIDAYTAPAHRLFEAAAARTPPLVTIGIGDGGNEIGMGRFAWGDIARAVPGGGGGRIACRVATDMALIAGVSNWGAYALGLAMLALCANTTASHWLEPAGQRELVETLVRDAGAVDGRTLRAEPTVDGLSLDEYLQPLAEMRAIVARR